MLERKIWNRNKGVYYLNSKDATRFCLEVFCCRTVTYFHFMQIIRAHMSSILNIYKTMFSKYLLGGQTKYNLTLSG